ncbi:Trichome birefringence-like, N-terminal domain [Dillenia turbinata]|uniref:Trichome birefringence-like, N-terminal domain n=1 Tax=Dillenia turbinata TaxID=194707 RepID=A0AAN8ZQM8_9MAGN
MLMQVPTDPVTCGIRNRFSLLVSFLVAMLVTAAVYQTRDSVVSSDDLTTTEENTADSAQENSTDSSQQHCDYFSGKWVFDNQSHPLYKGPNCSFMFEEFACEKYGRKDLEYENWRWQPEHCNIPRFDALRLLEKLRGKRVVFIGDSLNRNQWFSLTCMLDSAIPPTLRTFSFKGTLMVFKAIEYNATLEFYWAPHLVESNNDDPRNHSNFYERIVRVESIEKHGRHWIDADILVFSSYLWWRWPRIQVLWGSFNSSDGIYKDVPVPRCYEMALQTWSNWLEIHINHSRTQIFFTSMSPTHQWAEEWGGPAGGTCLGEREPITKEGYWGRGSHKDMMRSVEEALEQLKRRGVNVQFLNITQLSEYRREGHSMIYRKFWKPEQRRDPIHHPDCTHWCLPGVPDTWNEILYAYLVGS